MPWSTDLSTILSYTYVGKTLEIQVMTAARDTGTDIKIFMNVYEYSYHMDFLRTCDSLNIGRITDEK